MVNFVLVAGARLGAWAWDSVVPYLGGGVHPVTLSGLAEKRNVPAGQRTHVQDIVGEVERLDLHDVVLVGHSYAGIPVGQAAGRLGDRLARTVFVDSSLPVDGEPALAAWPDGGAAVRASLAENGGFWPVAPASHFEGHGLTDEQITRIVTGSTPHPGATLTEPAVLVRPLEELDATYIKCTLGDPDLEDDVAKLVASDRWRLVEMATGHWPMFSQPQELSRILLDIAAN